MSEAAKIMILNVPKETLLMELAKIEIWDHGHNYDIKVCLSEDLYIYDKISNLKFHIENDALQSYMGKFAKILIDKPIPISDQLRKIKTAKPIIKKRLTRGPNNMKPKNRKKRK